MKFIFYIFISFSFVSLSQSIQKSTFSFIYNSYSASNFISSGMSPCLNITNDTIKSGYLPLNYSFLNTSFIKENSLSVFPNPSNYITKISSESLSFSSYILLNISGQIIVSKNLNGSFFSTTLNVSQIQNGVYFLKVFFSDGSFSTIKIIKI